jgi:hypothetical protein
MHQSLPVQMAVRLPNARTATVKFVLNSRCKQAVGLYYPKENLCRFGIVSPIEHGQRYRLVSIDGEMREACVSCNDAQPIALVEIA